MLINSHYKEGHGPSRSPAQTHHTPGHAQPSLLTPHSLQVPLYKYALFVRWCASFDLLSLLCIGSPQNGRAPRIQASLPGPGVEGKQKEKSARNVVAACIVPGFTAERAREKSRTKIDISISYSDSRSLHLPYLGELGLDVGGHPARLVTYAKIRLCNFLHSHYCTRAYAGKEWVFSQFAQAHELKRALSLPHRMYLCP